MRFINGGRPVPIEELGSAAHFLTPRGGEAGVWSAFEMASGAFVGWFSLIKRENGVGQLGYRLRADWWGRGFGSEGAMLLVQHGFENLRFERITASTMAVNEASRRVLETVGLTYVRTVHLTWAHPIPGSEHGDVDYEITRDAFRRRSQLKARPRHSTTVRRARAEDAGALVAIIRDTFESTWRPQISTEAAEAFMAGRRPEDFVERLGLQFWVAERDGKVVGFVYWDGEFVHSLHVFGHHARQGVGAALMDAAEQHIATTGFPQVVLETDTFNTASRAFYAARGYREADRYPDHEWDSGLTTLLLVKGLPDVTPGGR